MLKSIDPLLTPDLLKVLAEMGHGDELVVADANFTAVSLAAGKPLVALPAVGVQRAALAVLSLLPLDAAVPQPLAYMHVCGRPDGWRSAFQRDLVHALASAGHAVPGQFAAVERFAFYERVRRAFAIVHTGELQPYANMILKKGVIGEPLVE